MTAGCSCQTVVVSLPLAVPRAGRVVDPGDLLGGRSAHPHVPDAEIAQLRGDVGVGGAGHQPLDQVADLVGGGRRAAEGEPAVRVAEPELVVGDDRVVRLPAVAPSCRRSMASTRTPASDSIAFCRYGGSASSPLPVDRSTRPGPDPPAGRAEHGDHDQQTGDHAGGLLPTEAAVAQLDGEPVDADRRRPAPGRRRRSAGTARSRVGSRCRSGGTVTTRRLSSTAVANRAPRWPPRTRRPRPARATGQPDDGGHPDDAEDDRTQPQRRQTRPDLATDQQLPDRGRRSAAADRGVGSGEQPPGYRRAARPPRRPDQQRQTDGDADPTDLARRPTQPDRADSPRTTATRISEGSKAVSPTSTTPAPQPPRHASGARGRRSTRPRSASTSIGSSIATTLSDSRPWLLPPSRTGSSA